MADDETREVLLVDVHAGEEIAHGHMQARTDVAKGHMQTQPLIEGHMRAASADPPPPPPPPTPGAENIGKPTGGSGSSTSE